MRTLPDMPTPSRRLWVTGPVAALVVVATAAVGAHNLGWPRQQYSDEVTRVERITEIQVSGGGGDIVIRPGDPARVEIRRTLTYHRRPPVAVTFHINGPVLHVNTDCGQRCGVDYVILAPPGVRLSGTNDSGTLRAIGLSSVDIYVDSGDVELVSIGGPVVARTSSGTIRVELDRPADVTALTASGDILVSVPAGDYRVDADAGGEADIRIAASPSGVHRLILHTAGGDITVSPR